MSEQYKKIAITQLQKGIYQPRREFDSEALAELAQSIKQQGIIEPIIVRPITQSRYEIIAGERRWRASQLAELEEVPCLVREYSDEEAAEISLIENIQREDLNPIEEAYAYKQLMEEFDHTHEKVAAAVGKSRTKITNALRLLKLDSRVQQLLIEKKLSEGHGKILASIPYEKQMEVAQRCCQEGWSVRKLEELVESVLPTKNQVAENHDPSINRLERLISDHLGSDVKIENDVNHKRGWLKIRYHDYEILNGILEKIGFKEN